MTNINDRIRERAYVLWEQAGCPEGREMDFWLQAEIDVTGDTAKKAPAKKAPAKKAPAKKAAAPKKAAAAKKPAAKKAPAKAK